VKLFLAVAAYLILSISPALAADPELQSGDIVFQTSSSTQSNAIMWASKSWYSHTGVVEVRGGQKYVIEAIAHVSRTPLADWIARGRFGRYAVYRLPGMSDAQRRQVVAGAARLLGRAYDIYFTSHNNEIYCSELVEMAYHDAGVDLGKFQKLKELDVDNALVRALLEKRWRGHPLCARVRDFDSCWRIVQEDELITPIAIAKDSRLQQVYTNYPWPGPEQERDGR
jgi:hypothetical protein